MSNVRGRIRSDSRAEGMPKPCTLPLRTGDFGLHFHCVKSVCVGASQWWKAAQVWSLRSYEVSASRNRNRKRLGFLRVNEVMAWMLKLRTSLLQVGHSYPAKVGVQLYASVALCWYELVQNGVQFRRNLEP